VLGAAIMVLVLLVVLPVSFLIGGAVLAAVFGQSLTVAKERDHEGSELVELS
jgi:flagellar basal body-associated protein FliL